MTNLEELKAAQAKFKARVADKGLTVEQRAPFVKALENVEKQIAEIRKEVSNSAAAATAAPASPKPATKEPKVKKKMTDAEKAAFAINMKAAREAKNEGKQAAGVPSVQTASKPTTKPLDLPKGFAHIGKVKIGCDFDVYENQTDGTLYVPNVKGELKASKGDFILILEDGHSFTAMSPSAFQKRCIRTSGEKLALPVGVPQPAAPSAAKETPKPAAKPESAPKAAKPEHAHVAVVAVVKEMQKDGCEVHTFLKETKNTPLDAWIQGKIIDFTNGKTDEWVERVYIDEEHGDFYAQIKFKSATGWLYKPYFVKVCPERGVETKVSANSVVGKKYRIQYGQDKLKAMYHFPEDISGCRGLAKEIYQIRAKHQDSSKKYAEYADRCRNPQWTEKYGRFIKWMHTSASEMRKGRPALSHGEALKLVAQEMRHAAAAA
jgi:hypothetical protein